MLALFISEEIKELVQIHKVNKGQQGCQELLGKCHTAPLSGTGATVHINYSMTEAPRIMQYKQYCTPIYIALSQMGLNP